MSNQNAGDAPFVCSHEGCVVKIAHRHSNALGQEVIMPPSEYDPEDDGFVDRSTEAVQRRTIQKMHAEAIELKKESAKLGAALDQAKRDAEASNTTWKERMNHEHRKLDALQAKFEAVASELDRRTEEMRKATAALLSARQTIAIMMEGQISVGNFRLQDTLGNVTNPFVVPISVFTVGTD